MNSTSSSSILKTTSAGRSRDSAKKVVRFVFDGREVRHIPQDMGTWENGQMQADSPSYFEVANGRKLAEQSLAQIEAQEQADAQTRPVTASAKADGVRACPRPNRTITFDDFLPREQLHGEQHVRSRVRAESKQCGSVTFDDFLTPEQLCGEEERAHRSRMRATSVSSVASFKSLSKRFKHKFRSSNAAR